MAPTPPTLAVWIVACAMSDAKFFTSRNWIKRGSFSPARGYERRAQNRRNRHQPSTRNEPMNPTTLSQARSAAHCVSIGRDGEGARSDGTTRPIDGRPRDPAGVFVRNVVLLGTAARRWPRQLPRRRRRPRGEADANTARVDRLAPSDRLRRLLSIAEQSVLADGDGNGTSGHHTPAAPIRTSEHTDPGDVSGTAGPGFTGGRRSHQAQVRGTGADRPWFSDQPRHRLAAFRRPAADRGRRPGQCLGRRSAAHTGQGPLGSSIEHRRRLYPTRRRRPGFQQGNPHGAEREFLLRRRRLVGDPGLDRCLLRAPGQAADAQFPACRHPDRQERRRCS